MTDIDFDELDKAVNSLMSTANMKTEPEKPAEELATPASTEPENTLAQTDEAAAVPVAVTTSQPIATTAVTPPARKRGGRFMDMVHPSADMAKRQAAKVSREGTTIAPVSSNAPTEEKPSDVPEVAMVAEPENSSVVEAAPETPVSSTMPDPIEVAHAKAEKELEAAETPETPEVPGAEADLAPNTDETETPLESPFLPDAKVEKRPLGGDAPAVEATPELVVPEDAPSEEISKAPEPDEPPVQPTQAELNPDVVAVEASEPQAFAEANKAAEKTASSSDEQLDSKPVAVASSGAISQQYKEEPSSGDASHTAIYDAENYPKTAPKAAKKKSGWLWVLWIFILLSLGAGGAVALYMMNII